VQPGGPDLTPGERTLVAATLAHFDRQRYDLLAYVVMNDHVHAIVTPAIDFALEQIVGSWKSHTTFMLQRETGRSGRVWQNEYYDRIIRGEAELIEKIQYVLGNPWRRWPDLTLYPWVGCRGFEEQE
jgi:putative transposase